VCRMNITDELLLRGRYADVVQAADGMLAAGEPLLRARAVIHHNRAHALVQLGRIAEAQASAQAVLRALPAYAHLVMDLFAQVAAHAGAHGDAALLAGCSARIRRERDLHCEASEVAMIDDTLQCLESAIGAARTAHLMAQGAAMRVSDVLPLAFKTEIAAPAPLSP